MKKIGIFVIYYAAYGTEKLFFSSLLLSYYQHLKAKFGIDVGLLKRVYSKKSD